MSKKPESKCSWIPFLFGAAALVTTGCVVPVESDGEVPADLLTRVPYCIQVNGCEDRFRSQSGEMRLVALGSGPTFDPQNGRATGNQTVPLEVSASVNLANGGQSCGTLDMTFLNGEARSAFTAGGIDPETLSLTYQPHYYDSPIYKLEGHTLIQKTIPYDYPKSRRDLLIRECKQFNSSTLPSVCSEVCTKEYKEVQQVVRGESWGTYEGIAYHVESWSCPRNHATRRLAVFGHLDGQPGPYLSSGEVAWIDVDSGELITRRSLAVAGQTHDYPVEMGKRGVPLDIHPSQFQLTSSGSVRVTFDCQNPEGNPIETLLAVAAADQLFGGVSAQGTRSVNDVELTAERLETNPIAVSDTGGGAASASGAL